MTAQSLYIRFYIYSATGQYLVAEFKMKSSEFTLNHEAEDVDVLICWQDDQKNDREKLPPNVLALHNLLEHQE